MKLAYYIDLFPNPTIPPHQNQNNNSTTTIVSILVRNTCSSLHHVSNARNSVT